MMNCVKCVLVGSASIAFRTELFVLFLIPVPHFGNDVTDLFARNILFLLGCRRRHHCGRVVVCAENELAEHVRRRSLCGVGGVLVGAVVFAIGLRTGTCIKGTRYSSW